MGKFWGKTFFPMWNALDRFYRDRHLNVSPPPPPQKKKKKKKKTYKQTNKPTGPFSL